LERYIDGKAAIKIAICRDKVFTLEILGVVSREEAENHVD
jgi:hypothetical protein